MKGKKGKGRMKRGGGGGPLLAALTVPDQRRALRELETQLREDERFLARCERDLQKDWEALTEAEGLRKGARTPTVRAWMPTLVADCRQSMRDAAEQVKWSKGDVAATKRDIAAAKARLQKAEAKARARR